MDVEQRLLDDAQSFAKEVASLDKEGFIARTLTVLGLTSPDSDAITESRNEEETPGVGRSQRLAPPGAPDSDLFVKSDQYEGGQPIPRTADTTCDCPEPDIPPITDDPRQVTGAEREGRK